MEKWSAEMPVESGRGAEGVSPNRRRIQMILLLSGLCLPACGKTDAEQAQPASSADVPVDPIEAGLEELVKAENRGDFARNFAKELQLRKKNGGFALPPGFERKLDQAMIKAGQERGVQGVPSAQEFWKTEQAVLAVALDQLFDEWRRLNADNKSPDPYRGAYHREVYEHYLFLRQMEVMRELPARAVPSDFEEIFKESDRRRHEAWSLVQKSTFYGVGKDLECGPLEAPYCEKMKKAIKEMVARMPGKDSEYYDPSHPPSIRSSVVDMYLPGMYLRAIRERLALAGVSAEDIGFNEDDFEKELKESYMERSKIYSNAVRVYSGSKIKQRLFGLVGRRFKELGEADHPLKVDGQQ